MVLKTINDKHLKLVNGTGGNVKADRMRLKSQSSRWYVLKRAQEIITKKFEGQDAKIEIMTELPIRKVVVNDEIVFTQEHKKQLTASFVGSCSDLTL